MEYILLIITTFLIAALLFLLIRMKNKSHIHYVFISIILLLIIWSMGAGLDKWSYTNGYDEMIFANISFIGVCFIPIPVLLLGIIFARTRIKFTYKHLLLFIVPVVSYLILLTNKYHNLFFEKYSFISGEFVYGKYFIIHAVYSYMCIFIGLYYLIYFSIKNTGIFSKQSLLILTGFIIPLAINILLTLGIYKINQVVTPISFSFTVTCLFIAIFKYDFLQVLPIAMQIVVDRISNSFIVIDLNFRVVDFNKTFLDTFNGIVKIKRKDNILEILYKLNPNSVKHLKNYIEHVHETGTPFVFEHHFMEAGKLDEFFTVEITPIINNKGHLGTIIMLTNISQHKKDLDIIKSQQQQITEKERLASLGTLMGGISHNMKTPIMSIAGCITALEDLANEYRESIGNPVVNDSDHHEIAAEMLSNLVDLKGHTSYISNALTSIKNQVINPDSQKKGSFTLEELTLNIEFLMKYELKINFCTLNITNEAGNDYLITGDIGTFVQIINNLISNAIQSYDKIDRNNEIEPSCHKIELIIKKAESQIMFIIKDYGKGISPSIKDKLFKEMVTTKGKAGSGIGLYLSYSKIKVMFNGDMWFESEEGTGTSFYIKI